MAGRLATASADPGGARPAGGPPGGAARAAGRDDSALGAPRRRPLPAFFATLWNVMRRSHGCPLSRGLGRPACWRQCSMTRTPEGKSNAGTWPPTSTSGGPGLAAQAAWPRQSTAPVQAAVNQFTGDTEEPSGRTAPAIRQTPRLGSSFGSFGRPHAGRPPPGPSKKRDQRGDGRPGHRSPSPPPATGIARLVAGRYLLGRPAARHLPRGRPLTRHRGGKRQWRAA